MLHMLIHFHIQTQFSVTKGMISSIKVTIKIFTHVEEDSNDVSFNLSIGPDF